MNQQAEALQGIMKEVAVLGDRLRHGTVTGRDTWQSLDEMWELLHGVVAELRKEQ